MFSLLLAGALSKAMKFKFYARRGSWPVKRPAARQRHAMGVSHRTTTAGMIMNRAWRTPTAVALSAVVLAGCASPIRTEPTTLTEQTQIYRDGVPSTISKKRYVVMASSSNTVREGEGEERMRVVASVANTSSNPIDISTANFLASVDGKPLKILTYEEIAQEIRSKQAWAAFAVALGGAMQAAALQQQASYRSTYGTYNARTSETMNTYGARTKNFSNFNANTSGTYTNWTYDPAAGQATASAVNANTVANMSALRMQGKTALRLAEDNLLKRTTVSPNTSNGGQLVVGEFSVPVTGATLELVASIDGETHTFQFQQQHAGR